MDQNQLVWSFVSFILTLMIFSYILGDNPLFRIASYFFIGVSSAYVSILIIYQIIIPKLILPLIDGSNTSSYYVIVPIILCLLLITKFFPGISRLGSIPMAFLVGIGAAIIITGSIFGTLFPQIEASTNYFSSGNTNLYNPAIGLFTLLGTISTLIYFQFSTRTKLPENNVSRTFLDITKEIGKIFIGITLGAIFAGIILSALIALIERIQFIATFITSLF